MYKNNIYIYQSIYIYIYFDMYKYVCTYTPWGGAIHIYIYIHIYTWQYGLATVLHTSIINIIQLI